MISRIYKSIINRLRQTSLLLVVMFVISCLLCSSYFFKNVGNEVKSSLTKSVKSLVSLSSNVTFGSLQNDKSTVQAVSEEYYADLTDVKNKFNPKYMDINLSFPNITPIKAYGEVYGLAFYGNYEEVKQANRTGDFNDIEQISTFDEYKNDNAPYFSPFKLFSCQNSDFSIIHYKYNYHTYKDGEETIINYTKIQKGRTFSDDEIERGSLVCVVTPKTYQYVDGQIKKVDVGDYISYSIMLPSDGDIEIYKTYDLEVIGILNDRIYFTPNSNHFAEDGAIIPEKLFMEMYDQAKKVDYSNTYYLFMPCIATLSDFEDIEEFINYMQELNTMDGKNIKYETSLDSYYSFAGNIEAISNNTNFLFKFALVATIILYILIINLDLNRRKKEIGLLSSLGQSKTSLMIELTIQYILVPLIALVLAIVVSSLLSKHLVTLFENIDSINNFTVENKTLDYTDSIKAINNLQINIDNSQLLKIAGIEIIVIIISTIISVLSIFTLKVREVMIDE